MEHLLLIYSLIGYKAVSDDSNFSGPMNTTVEDFLRLLWEQDVKIIVMLTRLKEGGKVCITSLILLRMEHITTRYNIHLYSVRSGVLFPFFLHMYK